MIEQIVLDYLTEHIDVPVFMELPEVPSEDYPTMPERFILLEKVGGGQTDHIDSGSIAVQSYSLNSLYEAASLDEEMRNVMFGMVALNSISEIRLASNYMKEDEMKDKLSHGTLVAGIMAANSDNRRGIYCSRRHNCPHKRNGGTREYIQGSRLCIYRRRDPQHFQIHDQY